MKKMDSDMDIDQCCSSDSSSSSSSSENVELLNDTDFSEFCKDMVFVDLRGFRSRYGRFICKEFCLIDNSRRIYHQFVQSQFPVEKLKYEHQIKVQWEEKVGHKIPYDYGDINIIELITDTHDRFNGKTVLVSSSVDKRHLKYIFRNCSEIKCITLDDDLDFDENTISNELDLLPLCDFHNRVFGWDKKPRCAKNTALRLRYIYTKSQKNSIDKMSISSAEN